MEEKKTKQERTVIHLYQKGNNTHHYFGSMANIFEFYSKENIGITFGSLRNYGLSPEKPYENKLVIIRKGILLTKPKAIKDILNKDIIDLTIPTDIEVAEKEQLVNETVLQENCAKSRKKKKFDKTKLEQYLSEGGMIRHSKYFSNRRFIPERIEYYDLVNSILNLYNISQKNKIDYTSFVYTDSYKIITEILSKICIDESEIIKYKNLIDAKLTKNIRVY